MMETLMIGLLPHILLSRTFATTPIATLHANHGQRKTWECLRFSTETVILCNWYVYGSAFKYDQAYKWICSLGWMHSQLHYQAKDMTLESFVAG